MKKKKTNTVLIMQWSTAVFYITVNAKNVCKQSYEVNFLQTDYFPLNVYSTDHIIRSIR